MAARVAARSKANCFLRGLGHTRAIAESLAVPVTFDTVYEQKRDETKPTRLLTASECPILVETVCDPTHLLNLVFNRPCGPGLNEGGDFFSDSACAASDQISKASSPQSQA